MFSDDFILFLTVLAFILGLGVVIFLQDKKNKLHRSFLLLSSAMAIWVFSNYMEDAVTSDGLKLFLLEIDFISALLMTYAFFNFCINFSANYIKIKRVQIYQLMFFIIWLTLSFLILFSDEIITKAVILPTVIDPVYGNLYPAYLAFLISLIAAGISLLVIKYRREDAATRRQTILIISGFALMILAMIVTNIVLSAFFENIPNFLFYSRLGIYSVLILVGFMSYAIAKNNFLNIRLITAQLFSSAMVLIFFFEIFAAQSRQAAYFRAMLFLLALYFSRMLIVYVELEVKRKKELEIANNKLEIAYDEITDKNDELEAANQEISERKDQLQKMTDSLSITNERLKVANDKLKVLDQVKNDFINFASHQLRTPITGIKGFASLLMEGSYGELEPKQKDAVEKIGTSTERMSTLVEDFLNASKIESGGMKYELDRYKMEDICQEVVTTLFPKANSSKLYLEYKKPEESLPELLIDGPKVKETISNLIDNAIKYTKEGGVTVKLKRAEVSNYRPQITNNTEKALGKINGPVIRVTVSDTGIGIPPDELPRLFAKFSRGKDTKRLNATGTGLGLYVGKTMTEAQGGRVWAESDGDGKGSRFIVELPINPPETIKESKLGH